MADAGGWTFFARLAVLAVILFGHLAIWIALFNRAHGHRVPRRWIRISELVLILAAIVPMYVLVWWYQDNLSSLLNPWRLQADFPRLVPYAWLAIAFATWTAAEWMHRQWFVLRPPQLISNDTRIHNIAEQLDHLPVRGWTTKLFAHMPRNQMFELCVNEKVLQVPRLPRELDGLSITHLSDLHFSGRVTRPFFDQVIDQAIGLAGDLVAITGDIQEEEECYEWLLPTLGRFRAPNGVYFVLGNHDLRLADTDRLRRELTALGLVDLGRGISEFTRQGRCVQLGGNELPWFGPAPTFPERTSQTGLRLLLAHSPDQIARARREDVDLMLAGHTHGGHIRLPFIGPIVCPSRYGVRFAGGVFFEPPTVMHVSRGISGLDPVRFNCLPELTKLVLRSPHAH